jgi:hypothetical protein
VTELLRFTGTAVIKPPSQSASLACATALLNSTV